MKTDYAIETNGLVKTFGRGFRLGPLDLRVPSGAIYGLIGPNGAGKTTTIDLLLNIGREDAGRVSIFGEDHRRAEASVKQRIGYVSPEINYDAWNKVDRLLRYIRGFYPSWDESYCQSLLDTLGLKPTERIRTLSFGNRVKLNLIVALSHRPALLLLDEPTIGLDAVSRQQVFGELLQAVHDEDRTVLISSHGLSDVERFADHVGFIKDGQLLLEGETDALVNRFSLCDYTRTNGTPVPELAGFYPQQIEEGRLRAVIDREANLSSWVATHGLTEISSTAMNLEDLFVALAKD